MGSRIDTPYIRATDECFVGQGEAKSSGGGGKRLQRKTGEACCFGDGRDIIHQLIVEQPVSGGVRILSRTDFHSGTESLNNDWFAGLKSSTGFVKN